MEAFSSFITSLGNWIWGATMLILLCGTHIFMTLRTGFIQKKTFTGIRLSVTKDPDSPGDVSQFQALTTALASTIGTGNIIGVGTAIYLGGPGAVLWCWLTGVFGIATKYAESLIAVKHRVQTADGRMMGGAMYALERGLKWKKFGKVMAVLFALFAMLASFGTGCGTQINAIAEVIETNLPIGIPRIAIGIVFGIVTAIIILGGIESIATVCEKLVPVMALFYVLGCIVILGINFDYILPAFRAIFTLAFRPGAVAGGLVGGGIRLALQYGVARGLFSNESGMGSAPLVASAAQTRNPVRQALVSATGTFWTTVVVCLMTGLVLISTIMKNPAVDMASIANGGQMTTIAFAHRPGHPCVQHYHLRLLDHPRLVVLRRAGGGVSARPKGDSAVQAGVPRGRRVQPGARARPYVVYRGHSERADGDPEPDRGAAALGRHRAGDKALPQEPRRGRYDGDTGRRPVISSKGDSVPLRMMPFYGIIILPSNSARRLMSDMT